MISPSACIAALWATWILGWLAAALFAAKTVVRQPLGSRIADSLFMWAGAYFLFAHGRSLGALHRPILPDAAWIPWMGVLLVTAGLGYTVWARVHLGRFWSASVVLKAEHALIRTGPYALTRHPIYTGLLLALIGSLLVRSTLSAIVGFTLFTVGVILKSRQEERLLTEHFGDAYRAYQAEVPGLIPRIRAS